MRMALRSRVGRRDRDAFVQAQRGLGASAPAPSGRGHRAATDLPWSFVLLGRAGRFWEMVVYPVLRKL